MHRCSTRIARCASLLAIALVGFPGAALSQRSETEHATVSMPKVYPGEYNGDLSKLRLQATPAASPAFYRPRLQGPPSTKLGATVQPLAPSPSPAGSLAPMPSPTQNFAGLSKTDA